MNYKVHINNSNYEEWELLTEIEMKKVNIEDNSFNPLKYKLFSGDVINDKYDIMHSPYRNDNNIPGIILLLGKTYGRTKNGKGKSLYKCIPHNKRLPAFLIPYEEKKTTFSKNITNKYVLFKCQEWKGKHPIALITNTIGDITSLSSFYEYQLYCKNLFISMKEFTNHVNNAYKQASENSFINDIMKKYPQIESRVDEYIISIDPHSSSDLDDAMSLNGDILSIYIANVPILMEHFNFWSSFSERISTIYLPDRKCPMMPSLLSENLCSLLENKERFAFCIDIKIKDHEIIDISFKNVLICVKKNYRYDDITLIQDDMYNKILSMSQNLTKTYKYVKEIKDSHDLVAYLMILMNYECANIMQKFKTGIYRTLSLKDSDEINKTELNDDIYKFIKIWQCSSGQYSNFDDKTGHAYVGDGLDNYIHITSPIRRLVDLLNMMNIQKHLNLFSMTESANNFYDIWIGRLDYINTTMRAIRRVQTDCTMLNMFRKNSSILTRVYNGYVFDRINWRNQYLQYTVYIPELKTVTRVNIKEDLKDYSLHKFKLYLFEDGETLKQKIRAEML